LGPGREELVVCDYFRMEKLTPEKSLLLRGGAPYYMLLICLKGSGQIAGQDFTAGMSWLVPAFSNEFTISGDGSEWLLSYTDVVPVNL
jgi:mannose-6-phosphate isomerase class I